MDVADYPRESVLKEDFEARGEMCPCDSSTSQNERVCIRIVVQVGLEATAFYELNFPVYEAVRST